MLANLDNEVYFKKVFTDVEVFTAFVKDVLGIDIHIQKVETEKVLPSKVSAIKFKMDLFAEDKAARTVVEIQKVDYDYTYNRFAHYFLANLIDTQRKSTNYAFAKDVYVIVVVTAAYKISDKNGKPIKNDVLITDINPRDLSGNVIEINNHKMVILNTTNIQPETPVAIFDWLNLIHESIKNPENPNINTKKIAIAKAAKLANIDDLTPEQLAAAKIHEQRKETVAFIENTTRLQVEAEMGEKIKAKEAEMEEKIKEKEVEMEEKIKEKEVEMEEKIKEKIKKLLKRGRLSLEEIAEDFDLTIEHVKQVENEMKNS